MFKDWSWKPDPPTKLAEREMIEIKRSRRRAKKQRKKLKKQGKSTITRRAPKVMDEFYHSWEWAKIRYEVLKAYGPICMCCRSTERIVVDHIKSRRRHKELQLEFDNLQVLCDSCNRGKSYDDETDFRPKLPEPELEAPEMEHLKEILHVTR